MFESIEAVMARIRPNVTFKICVHINKLVSALDHCNYRFPKPTDIIVRDISTYCKLGGFVSLKLDGRRTFLAYHNGNVYNISTKGKEVLVEAAVTCLYQLTVFDTKKLDEIYYAFDVVVLDDIVVTHWPLKKRIAAIPVVCWKLNRAIGRRLVVAKNHSMFTTFHAFSSYHRILEQEIGVTDTMA